MANPIEQASHLEEIKFPEFTAELITDTFKALIDANLRQMEAYTDLIKSVGVALTQYINNTRDDITGEQILAFLSSNLPALESDTAHSSIIYPGKNLSAAEATKLSDAVALRSDAGITQPTIPTGNITEARFTAIKEAVANRIAQNKYDLLTEMVKQGVLRLIVNNGTIETRLNFHAYQRSYDSQTTANYSTSTSRKSGGGGFFLGFFGSGSSYKKTNVNVSTQKSVSSDYSSSSVSIFGGVKIEFSTDYQKLGG